MIAPAPRFALIRYGAVPEVLRCQLPPDLQIARSDRVLAHTPRGLLLATCLELEKVSSEPGAAAETDFTIQRIATAADLAEQESLLQKAQREFSAWEARIIAWQLDLQLIELEYTFDGEKAILYVLNERGPDCTRLAIQAAAAGLGLIEVQPVSAEGLVSLPAPRPGGCGTGGGCGCHS
jgi:cell fate regulator YaaT (PSP1 superfamily)